MPPEKHSLKYSFAHIAFPILALGDPRSLLQKLSNSDASVHLANLWIDLAERLELSLPTQVPRCQREKFSDSCEAVIIQLPPPDTTPEAFFIGVVFWTRKRLFRQEVTGVRYFTLELGPFPDAPDYHFCEWTGRVPNPTHANFGELPSPTYDHFKAAIQRIIGTQR